MCKFIMSKIKPNQIENTISKSHSRSFYHAYLVLRTHKKIISVERKNKSRENKCENPIIDKIFSPTRTYINHMKTNEAI